MTLQFPTSVTPQEALETIAAWTGVTLQELQKHIEAKAPANSTIEQAKVQFVFGYVWRLWEDWYRMELTYLRNEM